MKALILGAGQGKRLMPMTEKLPKALLPLGDRSLVEWQIDALAAAGVDDILFVSGFNARAVETVLARKQETLRGCRLRTLHNPFYPVADNITSCWLARGEMTEDFLLLNGDTIFRAPLLRQLLASPPASLTLAIDRKPAYDEDDMKVCLDGTRLREVSKKIPAERVNGESIGCMVFRGDGPRIFAEALAETLFEPVALRLWYLSVIDKLAGSYDLRACSIEGHEWCEIDYPLDLKRAEQIAARWQSEPSIEEAPSGTAG